MHFLTTIQCLFLLCVVAILAIKLSSKRPRAAIRLPPGPKSYPIIGNIFDLPKHTERSWERFAQWRADYGDIMTIKVLDKTMIIVHDSDTIMEMFDKKGSIYSGRAEIPMMKLCNFALFFIFYQYSKALKEARKLLAHIFGTTQVCERVAGPCIDHQSTMLLKRILTDPEQFEQAIVKTAGALVLQVTYGYQVQEEGVDPFVHAGETVIKKMGEIVQPARFLVDIIPSLRHLPTWFPLARDFHAFAADGRRLMHIVVNDTFDFVREGMKRGACPPSYVGELLAELKDDGSQNTADMSNLIKYSAATLYAAGTDTTAYTIITYLLVSIVWPNVQQKLQSELDSVIGRDRLPSVQDRKTGKLSYADAVVKELFRFFPIAAIGVPHLPVVDDIQGGFIIPKGAMVIPNIWYLLHDPARYNDPFTFKPERFLGPNPERDPYDFCFGFGRRICPGMKLADLAVWYCTVKLAFAFNITKAVTPNGEVIEPVVEQLPNTAARAHPFKCRIKQRWNGVADLIGENIELSGQ